MILHEGTETGKTCGTCKLAELLQLHHGRADFLLKVVAEDLQRFSRFLLERLGENFESVTTRSEVSLEQIKHTTALPVAAQMTHHCTTSLDPCYTSLTDPNFLAVFDPCSSSSCQR